MRKIAIVMVLMLLLVSLAPMVHAAGYGSLSGPSTVRAGDTITLSYTIGGGVSGIAGMLIAVPIAATIYKLVRTDIENKNKKSRWDLLSVPEEFETKENEEQLQK